MEPAKLEPAAEERDIVAQYAEAKALEARANDLLGEARARALALHERTRRAVLYGEQGVVTVSRVGGSRRLDGSRVRELVSPELLDACYVTGKSTVKVEFKPAAAP